jgi:hypothetical protein
MTMPRNRTITGTEIKARREATGLRHVELIAFLDSKGFSGWSPQSLAALERSGEMLDELASAEFFRAFEEAVAAGDGAGNLTLPEPADPRSWEAVRQTPAFAVALDIARQERHSYIKKQQARQALEAGVIEGAEGLIEDEAQLDFFRGALGAYRNDNNVLWGAARILATMVDDDELGVLTVLRAELDRQDGVPASNRVVCQNRWPSA